MLKQLYSWLRLQEAPMFRHRSRRTALPYVVVGQGTAQCSEWNIQEGDEVVVYLGGDGKLYVRHKEEFYSGRFKEAQE